ETRCCAEKVEYADHRQNAHKNEGESISKLVAEHKIGDCGDRKQNTDDQQAKSSAAVALGHYERFRVSVVRLSRHQACCPFMLRGRAPTGIRVPRVPGIFSISQDVISIIRISDFLECTFPHSSALTWKRAANMSGY